MSRLILASTSPQRHKILRDAGFKFEAVDPGDAEDAVTSAPTPEEFAIRKAAAKAGAAAGKFSGAWPAIVIGCDTIVELDGCIIGKPVDRNDAVSILRRLAGQRQRVISGLSLWPVLNGAQAEPVNDAVTTVLRMKPMSAAQIAAYVASGQSDGKAGAYAIQENGDEFVQELQGSFLNVVGFPLERFQELLPQVMRRWKIE